MYRHFSIWVSTEKDSIHVLEVALTCRDFKGFGHNLCFYIAAACIACRVCIRQAVLTHKSQILRLRLRPFSHFQHPPWASVLRGCHDIIQNDPTSITSSPGMFKRRFRLRLQCFQYSESVAHVTEKVRSPRDEILSPGLLHVGIGGSAVGTLGMRISFHLESSLLSADLLQTGQQETGYALWTFASVGKEDKFKPMQFC